ncbi:MAG: four-helix bundle copper-binding protein [Zoogloea sp.]|nr:four-helix bundle copper-binding protein [Zoogloea sp.]
MAYEDFRSCVEACDACAAACSHCAVACLAEPDPKPMARCIALDLDCADICRLASTAMARNSDYVDTLCVVCADICDACAQECSRHPMEHCRQCADMCKRCADECRRMQGLSIG